MGDSCLDGLGCAAAIGLPVVLQGSSLRHRSLTVHVFTCPVIFTQKDCTSNSFYRIQYRNSE